MKYPDDFINKVVCGDCLGLMKELPDRSVHLIFADPPFNVGKNYGKYRDDRRLDYQEWCEKWITECFRILKAVGSFYLMTLTRHLEWQMPLMAKYGKFINLIQWKNVSAAHCKDSFWNNSQPIMLYGKSDFYTFNTYAETQTAIKDNLRWGSYSTEYKGQLKDYWDDIPFVYAGSIIHSEAILKKNSNQKAHPTQMPIRLPQRSILFSTDNKENDIVLDPFMGSGTTAIACIRTNRNFIGFEISPEYCKIANERIEKEKQGFFGWKPKENKKNMKGLF